MIGLYINSLFNALLLKCLLYDLGFLKSLIVCSLKSCTSNRVLIVKFNALVFLTCISVCSPELSIMLIAIF